MSSQDLTASFNGQTSTGSRVRVDRIPLGEGGLAVVDVHPNA